MRPTYFLVPLALAYQAAPAFAAPAYVVSLLNLFT